MKKCVLLIILCILLIILISFFSCSYGHRPYNPVIDGNFANSLFTIEIDDYGAFWSPDQTEDVLNTLENQSKDKNTIILLYVHGWHHNAKDTKGGNLEKFKYTLGALREKLAQPLYVNARRDLTDKKTVSVFGIYVGWRGRSMPGFLDYLTVWGRKSAAERVGAGDLSEFLARLQKLYEIRNSTCKGRSSQDCKSTFLGLVLVGHSLGGQVLFKSVTPALERQMIDSTISSSWNQAPTMTDRPAPLSAIGDMTVLINPALEAYQYNRLHHLNSQLNYNYLQTPVLLVISGKGDTARQIAFPLARTLSRPFRPGFRDFQKKLWNSALGEYEPQRTHQLQKTKNPDSLTDAIYKPELLDKILQFDFSSEVNFKEGKLTPLPERSKPYNPIIVAYSSEKFIEGHSGIFTETFRNFLIDYIAFIEGKRMIVNREKY